MVILLLALLVLGPDKLPSTAKKVGKFMHEFRRMTSGFEQEVRRAMDLDTLDGQSSGPKRISGSASSDALHRATSGPQLSGPTSPSMKRPSGSSATSPFVADLSEPERSDDQQQ